MQKPNPSLLYSLGPLSKFGADEAEIVLMPGAMFRAESAQRSSTPNRDRVVLTFMDSDQIG